MTTTGRERRRAAAAPLVAAAVLGLGAATAVVASGDDPGATREKEGRVATEASDRGPKLPIEEAIARVRAAGYDRIREVEREHGRYEVKARDREGRRVKLYVDARTGELLERGRRRDDDD